MIVGKKNSSGNITISLNKADAMKLNQTAMALGTSRENVIRKYIRDGHEFILQAAMELQVEREAQEAWKTGEQMDVISVDGNIGDDLGSP